MYEKFKKTKEHVVVLYAHRALEQAKYSKQLAVNAILHEPLYNGPDKTRTSE